jgi:hypothetical protein
MACHSKIVLDVVPFYGGIENIYIPYSYLDRSILGYQHWYAFRENYEETLPDGSVARALDPKHLARKVSPFTTLAYQRFLAERRSFVECITTDSEADSYQRKKADLFDSDRSAGRIVTALADFAHAFGSRTKTFLELVSSLSGSTLALTNLSVYADRARKACADAGYSVTCRSYHDDYRDVYSFDNIIYLESPIVKPYLLLDVEARVRKDANVFHMIGDAKVDEYLSGRIKSHIAEIEDFVSALWSAKNG